MTPSFKKIDVCPYNPDWPKQYKILAQEVQSALGKQCLAIHHVGSTSVPGLAAKPIIDMIADVKSLNVLHDGLLNIGYDYRGGFNIPLRKTFTRRDGEVDVNLHIFETGDSEIDLNLKFRDYLRAHPDVREAYAALKYQIIQEDSAHQYSGLYKGYTLAKHDFIEGVLKKAGFKGLRVVICAHYAEWDAAKQFRTTYFFDPAGIEDPYTWTFEHDKHRHLVLYQGVDIIGYAHVQLWPDNRAAVRMIVIDQAHRRHGYGKTFLTLMEKWLKLEGYKSLHTESSPAAFNFYKNLGYNLMPFKDPDGHEGSPDDIEMGKIL